MSIGSAFNKTALCGRTAMAALVVGAGLMAAPGLAAAAPAAASATGDGSGSEVVVTATRREEKLSRVPVAVTAIGGVQAREQHIENFGDLPALVPGATFISTKGQSTATVEIRGQSVTNDAPALEVPVAIFMDDIYYGTLASFDADFFDIGQIAILRGPQGTTFGRNVVGGALQITSNKAQLGALSGGVDLTAETYTGSGVPSSGGFESQGFVNVPAGDTMAGRLAYSFKDVGGYMHNYLTGHNLSDQKSYALRPSFVWAPTNDFRATAFLQFNHEDEYSSGYNANGQGSVIAANRAISSSPWASFQNVDGKNKRDIFAGQVRLDLTKSYGVLSAITSYRSLKADYIDDGDSGPLPTNNNSINDSNEYQFSEELRLTSPSGQKLEYVTGLYYSFENIKKAITFGFNGTDPLYYLNTLTGGLLDNQTAVGDAHVTNIAPYAEGKYHYTDEIALTVGARYTFEHKQGYTNHIGASPFYGAAFPTPVNFSHDWAAITPRVIAEYTPTHDLLFYASISTGFKGGGWSLTSTSPAKAAIPLQPETSVSYELGAKMHFFDNRLSLNLAAYEADTKNLQVRSLISGVLTDTNAGNERVRGIEVESVATPFHNAQIGVNFANTDAVYASFAGCAAGGVDCSGFTVPYVPKTDLRIFAQYKWDMENFGSLTIHADDEWAGKTQVSPLNNSQPLGVPLTKRNGILNGSLIYEPAHGDWKVQLWGKNLTNQAVMAAPSNYYFYFLTKAEKAGGMNEVDRGVVSPPRQIGATFSYKF